MISYLPKTNPMKNAPFRLLAILDPYLDYRLYIGTLVQVNRLETPRLGLIKDLNAHDLNDPKSIPKSQHKLIVHFLNILNFGNKFKFADWNPIDLNHIIL